MHAIYSHIKNHLTLFFIQENASKEDTAEDKTYLVISPAASGTFDVREGNKSSLKTSAQLESLPKSLSTSKSDSKVVVDNSDPVVNKTEPTKEEAISHTLKDQQSHGLSDNERNTLLSIVQRDGMKENTSREQSAVAGKVKERASSRSSSEDENEIKMEDDKIAEVNIKIEDDPKTASIYYKPEEDNSLSEDDVNEQEESLNAVTDQQESVNTVEEPFSPVEGNSPSIYYKPEEDSSSSEDDDEEQHETVKETAPESHEEPPLPNVDDAGTSLNTPSENNLDTAVTNVIITEDVVNKGSDESSVKGEYIFILLLKLTIH